MIFRSNGFPQVSGGYPTSRRCFSECGLWKYAAALLLAVSAIMGAPAGADVWSPPAAIAPSGTLAADIAASGTRLHMIYSTGKTVYYRLSRDAGDSFTRPAVLAQGETIHETDAIASDGNMVFAVTFAIKNSRRDWCCNRRLGDLILRRAADEGGPWSAPLPLTRSGSVFRASVTAASGRVHVVWSDFRGDRWSIYHRRSTDGGSSWEPEQLLAPPVLEENNRPQIAVHGDSVHVVWMDNRDGNGPCYTLPHCTETYYIRSLDGGRSWGPPVRLTQNRPDHPLLSGRPDIAAFADGTLVVSFDQDLAFGESGVQHVIVSRDRGTTWSAPTSISGEAATAEQTHASASAKGRVGAIAWFDRRLENNVEIFALVSEDSGTSWSKEELVSDSPGDSLSPHIALTSSDLHVIWLEQASQGYQVLYRRRSLPVD